MPVKKSDLYRSLWKSCDELRGNMDASQYKDYVLVLLFVKYVSDKYAGQPDALLDVPAEGGFDAMRRLAGDKEIGDKMNKIVARLAEANALRGVIDVADWNDPDKLGRGQQMVDRLTNLVAIFAKPELDFRANRAEGDDLLGDAYEYLMRHFATESGKSKGQFYTPAGVSRVMAQVVGLGAATGSDQSVHDPACGSGSLLVKAHDEARGRTGYDLALYGQEVDNATRAPRRGAGARPRRVRRLPGRAPRGARRARRARAAGGRAAARPRRGLDEQHAIAAVLADMDAELAALEQRLTKTRALKQAVMQDLLTGRTRLLLSGDARPAARGGPALCTRRRAP